MNGRRILLATAVISLLAMPTRAETPAAQEPLVLSLRQALDLAMEKNLDVALAEMDLGILESQYRQAIGAIFGDFRATAGYTRNIRKPAAFFSTVDPATGVATATKFPVGADNGFATGLSFEQPLFSGGRLTAGITGGRTRIAAGKDGVRAAREDVVFTVKRFFYAYFLADSTVAIQTDNLNLANEHLATIRERYRQGLDSDLIVLRQQVEVAAAETTLIQARNAADLAVTNLQKVLVLDVDRPLKPSGTLDPPGADLPPYDLAARTALDRNPSYSAARKATEAAWDLYRIYRADRYPSLKGVANFDWVAQSDDFSPGSNQRNYDFGVGLKLDWLFFTGGETRERIRQARIFVDQARNAEEKIGREIRVQAKQQWLGMNEATERARAQKAAVGQAQRALEATEVRYKNGQASQLELNDATFALNRARTVYAQASHDYWLDRAGLEKVIGTSLEEIR